MCAMKYLGLDYGEKRIGVAISDQEEKIAFPRATLANTPLVYSEIRRMCVEEKIGKIILGLPVSFSGGLSAQAKAIQRFGVALGAAVLIPIEYENEIFSTKIAQNSGVKREKTDQSAAALILQGYLDRQKKENIV